MIDPRYQRFRTNEQQLLDEMSSRWLRQASTVSRYGSTDPRLPALRHQRGTAPASRRCALRAPTASTESTNSATPTSSDCDGTDGCRRSERPSPRGCASSCQRLPGVDRVRAEHGDRLVVEHGQLPQPGRSTRPLAEQHEAVDPRADEHDVRDCDSSCRSGWSPDGPTRSPRLGRRTTDELGRTLGVPRHRLVQHHHVHRRPF